MKQLDLKTTRTKERSLELYHGSNNGVQGAPGPQSRATCDFGKALYLGTMREQAFSICLRSHTPHFYKCALDTRGLRVVMLDGVKWALYVGMHRGALSEYEDTVLLRSMRDVDQSADIVVGPIADDSMLTAFQDFLSNGIPDLGLLYALSAIRLGNQYALKTQAACERLEMFEVYPTEAELARYIKFDLDRNNRAKAVIRSARLNYYGKGKLLEHYFDEGYFNREFIPEC